MILLLTPFIFMQGIDFHIDPVVYRSTVTIQDTTSQTTQADIFYIEFNCEIPYHELSYEETDTAIITRAIIPFSLKNTQTGDIVVDTLYRQFSVPSFSEAARQQMSFIVQFGVHAFEGSNEYNIEIVSGKKQGKITGTLNLNLEDFPTSDLLLASEITIDTTDGSLKKSNLRVVPLPSHRFGERFSTLYLYYEIYDIIPDTNKLLVNYKIVDDQDKVVRKVFQTLDKKFKSQAINAGLNIAHLKIGQYTLHVEISEPGMQSITKDLAFEIIKKSPEQVSYEGLPYYEDIAYFLNPSDYKKFEKLPKEGKAIFLKKFWSQYDYYEIAERFAYADQYFNEGFKPGSRTDRGRIYIKYGLYDEIKRSIIDRIEFKPYEIWEYSNGVQFVFVDIRGTSEYTLVWTNSTTERSEPTLYDYLPESIKREIDSETIRK